VEQMNKLPGITVWVDSERQTAKTGYIVLTAEIEDPDTWEAAVAKLHGFRVTVGKTIQEAVAGVLLNDANETVEILTKEHNKLKEDNERLQHRISILEQSNREYIRVNAEWARLFGRNP
jgi:hypothetical protein